MKCAGCPMKIRQNEEMINCSSKTCKQFFHTACIPTQRLTANEIKTWVCPDCNAKNRKGGDNSQTPVRFTNENVTLRNKPSSQRSGAGSGRATAVTVPSTSFTAAAPASATADPDTLSIPATTPMSPADELHSLSLEITQFRYSAKQTWDSLEARLVAINEKISKYDATLKELEAFKIENIELKATVSNLQSQISNQAQVLLRNEVEVIGLEEYPNENPYHLALTTAVKLGISLQDNDLMYVSRAGPKRRDNHGHITQLQRPLVVAFTRRVKRDELLKQAKARRTLNSNDIVGQGPERSVYVNERLTSENRRLFRSTKEFAQTHKYKHIWIRNGAIFLRKRDASEGSPAIRIYSEEHLGQLSKKASPDRNNPSGDSADFWPIST